MSKLLKNWGQSNIYVPLELNEKQRMFQWIAIIISVAGTIVWGYGDIPFKT